MNSNNRKIIRAVHGIPKEQTDLGSTVYNTVTNEPIGNVSEIRVTDAGPISWVNIEVWVQPLDTTQEPFLFSEVLTHECTLLYAVENAEQKS